MPLPNIFFRRHRNVLEYADPYFLLVRYITHQLPADSVVMTVVVGNGNSIKAHFGQPSTYVRQRYRNGRPPNGNGFWPGVHNRHGIAALEVRHEEDRRNVFYFKTLRQYARTLST
jgi:hypothetical protein